MLKFIFLCAVTMKTSVGGAEFSPHCLVNDFCFVECMITMECLRATSLNPCLMRVFYLCAIIQSLCLMLSIF